MNDHPDTAIGEGNEMYRFVVDAGRKFGTDVGRCRPVVPVRTARSVRFALRPVEGYCTVEVSPRFERRIG
jgi:hypothetical protein